MKKVILFDIDHTLFNGHAYRESMYRAVARKIRAHDEKVFMDTLEKIYTDMRRRGPFYPEDFANVLIQQLDLTVKTEEIVQIIYDEELLSSSLFEETREVLEILSKNTNMILGIFSAGPEYLQASKIKSIAHFFSPEHIHIFLKKDTELGTVIEKYQGHTIYLIDDILNILYNASLIKKDIFTIWVKRGWIAKNQKPIEGFEPNLTVTNLREIVPLFKGNLNI